MIATEDRRQLAVLIVKGQYDAARCVERLLMDGETVRAVIIRGAVVHIEIAAPRRASRLWSDAGTSRLTNTEYDWFTVRFGCTIFWTMTRAEMEIQRIADLSRRVH